MTLAFYSNIRQDYSSLSVKIFDTPFGRIKPVKLEKINVYSSGDMRFFIFRKRPCVYYNDMILKLADLIV